jgi:hypothetical protein
MNVFIFFVLSASILMGQDLHLIAPKSERYSINFPETYPVPDLTPDGTSYISTARANEICEGCHEIFEIAVVKNRVRNADLKIMLPFFTQELHYSIDDIQGFIYMGDNKGLRVLAHGSDLTAGETTPHYCRTDIIQVGATVFMIVYVGPKPEFRDKLEVTGFFNSFKTW